MEILFKIIAVLLPLIATIYFMRMYRNTGIGLSLAYCIGSVISSINSVLLVINH